MATANSLIAILRQKGVWLFAAGDRVTIDAPKGLMTAQLLATLRAQKREVIAILREDGLVIDADQAES